MRDGARVTATFRAGSRRVGAKSRGLEIASSLATRRLRLPGAESGGPILGVTLAHDPRQGEASPTCRRQCARCILAIARVHPHSDGIAWQRSEHPRERRIFQRARHPRRSSGEGDSLSQGRFISSSDPNSRSFREMTTLP